MKFLNGAITPALRGLHGRIARGGKRILKRSADRVGGLIERSERTVPVVVTVLVAVSATAVGVSGLEALNQQGRLQDGLAAEVAKLEQEETELRDSIASLQEDPAAFALLAKTHHQLVEPGEIVVLLRQRAEPSPSAPDREQTSTTPGIRTHIPAPGRDPR